MSHGLRSFGGAILALMFLSIAQAQVAQNPADEKDPRGREGTLKVGDVAPDFTIQDVRSKKPVHLADLRGKPVVLFFGSCT